MPRADIGDRTVWRLDVDPGYSFIHRHGDRVVRLNYGGGISLIAGHAELKAALGDPSTFSSKHDFPNGSSPFLGVMTPPTPIRAVPIELDPPAHKEFKLALSRIFRPAAVEDFLRFASECTTWCLDQHIETGSIDLFNDLAKLVPAMTTMKLIGLPVEDAGIFADAVHTMSEDRFVLNPAWALLVRQTADAVRQRRLQPRADLISHLISLKIADRHLTDTEIFEVCFTMVVGGMATTARLLLGALSYLGVAMEDRRRLISEPDLIPRAIEEFLRYYSPVPILCRTAMRDTSVAGTAIAEGERVGMGYAAANRDPETFDHPDRVMIHRQPNDHLALGHGTHYCIGGRLGRMEAKIIILEVLRRIPDYMPALASGPIEGRVSGKRGGYRGLSWAERVALALPVTFTPSDRLKAQSEFRLRSLSSYVMDSPKRSSWSRGEPLGS